MSSAVNDALPSTDDLLERLKAAEQESERVLALLFHHYYGELGKRGMRRGLSVDETDTAVQVTFLKIKRNATKFDRRLGSADQWISTIFRNACNDQFDARPPEEVPLPEVIPAGADTNLAQWGDKPVTRVNEARKRKQMLANLHCMVVAVENVDSGSRDELRKAPPKAGERPSLVVAGQNLSEAFGRCRRVFKDNTGDDDLFEE